MGFLRKFLVSLLIFTLFKCYENTREHNKILCWAFIDPENHDKAFHLKNTWGKRCDYLLFFSSEYNELVPTIALNTTLGYKYQWAKTQEALRSIFLGYFNKAGWFLRVDLDTYVIMENLRFFLSDYNASESWFFGKQMMTGKVEYMYGRAGFVISRGALIIMVHKGLDKKLECLNCPVMLDDVRLGLCMKSLGINFGRTLDTCCKESFISLSMIQEIQPFNEQINRWIWDNSNNVILPGLVGCSKTPISFHGVKPNYMYILEYLLYNIEIMSQ